MKLTYSAVLLTATTLGLSGCQTSKNLLNGFTGGVIKTATLPTQSSSRIQFVIKDVGGIFIASPNSKNLKVNGKNQGIVATTRGYFDNIILNKEENYNTSLSDLGLPKPLIPLDPKKRANNVVERYVTPTEQIHIKYVINGSDGRTQSHCEINGNFTPETNTDYRITGRKDYRKCYVLLEKFVKNSDGTTTLQPMRFE